MFDCYQFPTMRENVFVGDIYCQRSVHQLPSLMINGFEHRFFLVLPTTTASKNSQSSSQTKPYCPRCGRSDCVDTYTNVESRFYHYPSDCRQSSYPHLRNYNADYLVEADFNLFAHNYGPDMDDFDVVGHRTQFCCFRPKKNSIVYVCCYQH